METIMTKVDDKTVSITTIKPAQPAVSTVKKIPVVRLLTRQKMLQTQITTLQGQLDTVTAQINQAGSLGVSIATISEPGKSVIDGFKN